MLGKIRRICKLLSTINIAKTIYLNFKAFPINIARKLPIYVGKNVDITGVCRGSISFQDGVDVKRGMVSIGVCHYPMVSNRGLVTLLRMSPQARLILGQNIHIRTGCSVIVSYRGVMCIGSDFIMNQKARLYCANSVTIGDHCRVGWESQIYDSNCHFTYDRVNHCIGNAMGKVSLGHNVWVGNRCTVSKGAVIPDYGIIASNSLVSKCLVNKNGGGIWAGMPVSLKREGFYRILDEDFQYKMFIRFSESQDIKIDKELSENELRYLLHM